jgi:hypothetical protein
LALYDRSQAHGCNTKSKVIPGADVVCASYRYTGKLRYVRVTDTLGSWLTCCFVVSAVYTMFRLYSIELEV